MLKKDLHVANSIDELNKMWESVEALVKNKTTTQMISSGKTLCLAGETKYREGDEENAYVLYGRYLNVLFQLQKKGDYHRQKNYIVQNLGGNSEQERIMSHLERLKESLSKRYDEKNMMENSNRILATSEVTSPVSLTEPKETRHSISCTQLYEMMEKESSRFIILDCRPKADYEESSILFNFMCNVPENLCCLGMTEGKVKDKLPNESKVFWEMRKNRSIIVFVDWFSKSFARNSPIWHLKTILTEWDQDIASDKKPEMILLEGGYDQWIITYPTKCSNPHVKVPKENLVNVPSMEGIEYPNVEDIVMKDVSRNTPTIDRSTKGNAMKNFEDNLSKSELLDAKEQLMNKSMQNEKDLLQLETNYTIEEDQSNSQHILYKILELQTKQKDNELEKETIDEVIKKAPVKASEISKVQDIENRLKQKEDEMKPYQQELEKRKKQRDERLRKARENKPNFDNKTPVKTPRRNELVLSPLNLNTQNSIPQFDRASKPTVSNQAYYDSQEFSPVTGRVERGLTGLKNLGNTCYMNSVLQCLSHTAPLRQFIMEGSYEKYINRTNNTKGHIIRTLAALVKMLWRGDCKYIASRHLKTVIGEQDNLFQGFDQQDAHEFLIMLIDWLQSDLQTIHMALDTKNENASEKAWLDYTKAKESFILRMFYGQIKSTLKCKTCGEESATFDTFSNLSLELPPIDIDRDNLTQCFNSYFHGEQISGWNCPKCKVPRDAIKKLDISKLPPVLIIHLKRFYVDPYGNFRKKTVYVDFPLTKLDLLTYLAPKERANIAASSRPYHLYAVSNHYGTLESGHYTAYCLSSNQKKWYKFDDQEVKQVDSTDVRSSAAYVLFYTNLDAN